MSSARVAGAALLLPAPLRAPAALASAVAASGLVVLAVRYAGGSAPRWFDVQARGAMSAGLGDGHGLWWAVVTLGGPLTLVLATLGLAALAWVLGRRRLAVLAVLGPGCSGALTTALKPVVGRLLRGELAFPSGQTAGATAFGLVAALLLISLWPVGRTGAALLLAAGAVSAGGLMAIALVRCGWHYPTDTVGGFCAASAAVLGCAVVLDLLAERNRTST